MVGMGRRTERSRSRRDEVKVMVAMKKKLLLIGVLSIGAAVGLVAQGPVPKGTSATAVGKATGPIIDNDRVRVWLDSQPGNRRPLNDAVSVFVTSDKATATFLPMNEGNAAPLVVG